MDPSPFASSPIAASSSDDAVDTTSREIELKLFVPPAGVARLRDHPLLVERAIGPLRIARIDNRYFDTPDRDLARHCMALRLRRIGRRWLQTLKVAGLDERAASARAEWEMAVAGPALETARLAVTPFAALGASVRARRSLVRSLLPIFTTNFRRESRLLRLDDGSEVEFAFDVGTIAAGRGKARRVLSICEVEIEWKHRPRGLADDGPGDPTAALYRFAAKLARDVALIPLAASKASRGYRLADRGALEPHRTQLPQPRGDDAPPEYLSRVLAASNGALLANVHALFEIDARARRVDDGTVASATIDRTSDRAIDHAIEPVLDERIEFVHQARVAVRRMRSALRIFRPVAKGKRLEALDEHLQSVGRVFGSARDWDVFMTTTQRRFDDEVGGDAAGRDALVRLRADAASKRADAHRALMDYLDAGDFGRVAISVERAIDRLSIADRNPKGMTLDHAAPRWLSDQCERLTSRSRRIAVLDATERHGFRVEVKRMRYALDLFEGLYESGAVERFGDALAGLQDKLGKLNDAVVAGTLVRMLGDVDGHTLVQSRHDAWLDAHVRKQLPKVAALSVDLELTPQPWREGSSLQSGGATDASS